MDHKRYGLAKVDGVLHWQCVCICANPQLYAPRPIEQVFLERVIRAHDSGRRLRLSVQVLVVGIVNGCKERYRCRRPANRAVIPLAR